MNKRLYRNLYSRINQSGNTVDMKCLLEARKDFLYALTLASKDADIRVILDPTYVGHSTTEALTSSWVIDDMMSQEQMQRCIDAAIAEGRKIHVTVADTNYKVSPQSDIVGFLPERSKDFTDDQEEPRTRDHAHLCLNNLFGPKGILRKAAEAGVATCSMTKLLRYAGFGYGREIDECLEWTVGQEFEEDTLHIISMSFGGSGSGNYESIFNGSKALLFAAAGNSGGSETQNTIGWPAKSELVACVGATARNWQRASFSSTGEELDFMAPGSGTPSYDLNGNLISWSGTSSACPNAVGFAALLYLENGDLGDQRTMVSFMEAFATDLLKNGHDNLTGHGALIMEPYLDEGPGSPPPDDEPDNPPTPPDTDKGYELELQLDFPLVGQYRPQGERVFRWMRFSSLTVKTAFPAKSALEAQVIARLRVNSYFSRFRAMQSVEGWDEKTVAKWLLQFLYFISKEEGYTLYPIKAVAWPENAETGFTVHNEELDPGRGKLGTGEQEFKIPNGVHTILTL